MTLALLIVLLLGGGLLAWAAERVRAGASRAVAVCALGAAIGVLLGVWTGGFSGARGAWLVEATWPWIPQFGIRIHLAMDGLSLLLVLLTLGLGLVGVMCSWTEIRERVGFFHLNLLWTLAGVLGVFLAVDLFLFFFAWELMVVPMYLLILLWGHENRGYAALKFFLFTQAGGLVMLLSILGLVFVHEAQTGVRTFDYDALLGTPMGPRTAFLLMMGFLVAFAVKLPAVPLHTWLPDAHTEAPTAGSVILAGVLLKTGAYGMIRFVVPLFPEAARAFAPVAMALGVVGILYGAALAFAQTDVKRLVAYTSISHLGFVLLGVFAWNAWALQGAVMQMICHGLSTGGLFALVGALKERLHTRDMDRMGGLWARVPRLSGVGLFFALASLGLPGLGNFVGEFLILAGAYRVSVLATAGAAAGVVLAAVYSLHLVQRTFHGAAPAAAPISDLTGREWWIFGMMIAALLFLGLFPQGALSVMDPVLERLHMLSASAFAWPVR